MELILRNIVEDVVQLNVGNVMREAGMCTCAKCTLDVMALALNNLKPKYVATEIGSLMSTTSMYSTQNTVTVYQELLKACQFVKENPRHDEYLKSTKK